MDWLVLLPAFLLVFIAVLLMVHHCWVHSQTPGDKAHGESCWQCCYMQPSDLRNHECWVVALFVSAATWTAACFYFQDYYSLQAG